MNRSFLAPMLACLFAIAAQAQPLRVTLSVTPVTTLPAIPAGIRMTFVNEGAKPLPVPREVGLVATTSDCGHFVVGFAGSRTVLPLDARKLSPGESYVEEFNPIGLLGTPGWFYLDFTRPGTYELQLYAGDYGHSTVPLETIVHDALAISNNVSFTVTEPQNDDATLWMAMKDLSSTLDWMPSDVYSDAGQSLVKRAVREFPEAEYTPWLASMGASRDDEERFVPLRQWLDRHPNDPYYDNRMLFIGVLETQLADKYSSSEPDRSRRHAGLAREALGHVRQSKSPAIREEVAERLQELDGIPQP